MVIASEQSFNKTKSNRANISGLIVLPKFRFIHNSNSLKDDDLIKELKKISGTPFKKPPTSILAVPEMNGKELKKPIKAVLLKYAVRKNNKFSEEEVIDNLLLGEKGFFSREARKKLSEKIKKVLLRLVSSLKENKKKE